MKAKEYIQQLNNASYENENDYIIFAHELLIKMVFEIETIAESRHANSDKALISIIKEIEKKSIIFINAVNGSLIAKESSKRMPSDAFRALIKLKMPDVFNSVWSTSTFIVCDSGKYWSWSMRIWVDKETPIFVLPEIELQMAQRTEPSARIIYK